MRSTFPVFDPASPQAESIRDLFVDVLFVSAGIFVIVAGLIVVALYRYRSHERIPSQDFGSHKRELAWMVGPVIIVLWIGAISAKLILTLNALPTHYAQAGETTSENQVDVIVTGHQWWWEVEYVGTGIRSANEIHIPTGKRLRVELRSDDVIHCFWVAQLTRKMDAIPGMSNYVWLEANAPGVYQGRCAEYCGTQHAWMNFLVIAHPQEEFEAWVDRESGSVEAPTEELAVAGQELFMKLTCSQCHAISGTIAKEDFAPDLTHFASRKEIGAGAIANNSKNLRTWLENPQAIKPGCKMPNFKLRDDQLDQLTAYLETLK